MDKKKHTKKLILLYLILAVSVGLMVYFGVSLLLNHLETRRADEFFASVQEPVDVMPRPPLIIRPTEPPVEIHEPNEEPTEEPNEYPAEPNGEENGLGEEYEPEPYVPEEPFIPFIDFDEVRVWAPRAVAWIQSEGTPINYPIVLGTDNEFYLYHLPDGRRNAKGSIFMDYRNTADFGSQVTILYGHNMASDAMFGSLKHYHNQSYFNRHSSMWIFTPTANYLLWLIAGYVIDYRVDGHYITPPVFETEEAFDEYIAAIRRRSIFTSQAEARFGDRLVVLATCTPGPAFHERLVIVGVLIEQGAL